MEYLSGKIFRYRARLFPHVNRKGAERASSTAVSVFDSFVKIPGIESYAGLFFCPPSLMWIQGTTPRQGGDYN